MMLIRAVEVKRELEHLRSENERLKHEAAGSIRDQTGTGYFTGKLKIL